VHAARLFAIAAVALLSAGGAGATAPASFHLVFDGRHNATLLHEGTFTTSSALCPSGSAADVGVDVTTDTALRRFDCRTGGDFTAKVWPLPAEHGGTGAWQIVAGNGPLANLRGKGTFTSTRLAGRSDDPATITFRSAWDGVADFDVVPPTVAFTRSTVRKLKRPIRTYAVRLVLSLTDPGGGPVSFVLDVVDSRKPSISLAYKLGQTSTGTVTLRLRIKAAKSTRRLRIGLEATDAVGNKSAAVNTIRLR
jgi:hypothetical protein